MLPGVSQSVGWLLTQRYSRVMSGKILARGDTSMDHAPVPDVQVVTGDPTTSILEIEASGLDIGLWEHSVGVSSDVEVDEIFVILSGSAEIDFKDGPSLTVGPGDVVQLQAGDQTTWNVKEPLRKFWVTP